MTFRADLHCHTYLSDGSLSPEQIIHLAKEVGLSAIAITDHDSIEAYSFAKPVADAVGIEIITGIECSTVHEGVSIHILGYAYPLPNPILEDFCRRHSERRTRRNRDILVKLHEHKMEVTEEEVLAAAGEIGSGDHTIGRPHIAQVMVQKGYVHSVQEAFQKFLGEDKCCYAPGDSFSTVETIEILHQAKGLAVIAHPHLIRNTKTVKNLLALPFDGIEGRYAKFSAEQNAKWINIGKEKNWIVTGGSDFHGDIRPHIPLGSSWVDEPTFRHLQKHFLQ